MCQLKAQGLGLTGFLVKSHFVYLNAGNESLIKDLNWIHSVLFSLTKEK